MARTSNGIEIEGTVLECLRDATFRVQLNNGHTVQVSYAPRSELRLDSHGAVPLRADGGRVAVVAQRCLQPLRMLGNVEDRPMAHGMRSALVEFHDLEQSCGGSIHIAIQQVRAEADEIALRAGQHPLQPDGVGLLTLADACQFVVDHDRIEVIQVDGVDDGA